MPELSYPFVFECANCETEIVVDRDTVRDMFEIGQPDFDSMDTIKAVLHQRGWVRDKTGLLIFCPDCAEGRE